MSVCCECCGLSGGDLCDELITRPEESYRMWCVVFCDLETSWLRGPWPTGGSVAQKKGLFYILLYCNLNLKSAVFVVGPAGPTTNTARLSPRYEGKTRGCHCSHWAPDDGRENAWNMLSCK